MTPSEILTFVRQRYNAVGDSFFPDSELLNTLYEANMILAVETECIEKRFTTSSVVGQREYDAPSYLIRVARITWNGKRLDRITFLEDDLETGNSAATTATGTPAFYTVWGETLFLRPTPNAVQTIEIFSINEPQPITLTSTLEIPGRLQIKLVNYILYTMFAKDANRAMASFHLQRWEKTLREEKAYQIRAKFGDHYTGIVDVDQVPFNDKGSAI